MGDCTTYPLAIKLLTKQRLVSPYASPQVLVSGAMLPLMQIPFEYWPMTGQKSAIWTDPP